MISFVKHTGKYIAQDLDTDRDTSKQIYLNTELFVEFLEPYIWLVKMTQLNYFITK